MSERDPSVTSKIMSSVRSEDTRPELLVRKRLWHRGYRYRKHYRKVEGKPDLAFPSVKLAVFVDGDFWHGNAWRVRGYDSLEDLFPSNTDWWVKKIRGNMRRDEHVTETLEAQGWTVLRFWSSVIKEDPERVVDEVARTLDRLQISGGG